MSDQLSLVIICLTVLLPEPVGPMTLEDVDSDMSPSKVMARTLSRCPLLPGPLCSPRQQVRSKLEDVRGSSGGDLCLPGVVVMHQSGVGKDLPRDLLRLLTEVGSRDDLYPHEAVALFWCKAKVGLSDDDRHSSEIGLPDDDLYPCSAAAPSWY